MILEKSKAAPLPGRHVTENQLIKLRPRQGPRIGLDKLRSIQQNPNGTRKNQEKNETIPIVKAQKYNTF